MFASLLRGIAVGAGAMYYLDPQRGSYRRSLVRDQFVHWGGQFQAFCDTACRDLENRWKGLLADTQAIFSGSEVSDEVLVERVRSQMGRCVSHPRNVKVEAQQGVVTLSGDILSREAEALIACVRGVQGVCRVRNELTLHDRAGNNPALQGAVASGSSVYCLANWSPASRMISGGLGSIFLLRGLSQSFPQSCVNGTIGLALIGAAISSGNAGNSRQRTIRRQHFAEQKMPMATNR